MCEAMEFFLAKKTLVKKCTDSWRCIRQTGVVAKNEHFAIRPNVETK